MSETAIPLSAPGRSYLDHRPEIDEAIHRVLASGWYILGPEVAAFETEFASFHGLEHATGVANGTDAIELALRALGVGPGDLVYTVAHTAVATVAAIERAGATAFLVDVDPATYTLDPNSLSEALRVKSRTGARPRAVVPVHVYGHPADMAAISAIARERGLLVVEDCAQAHGAAVGDRLVGTWGDASAFSFYPTKNLAAFGDGGAVLSRDPAVAETIRELREYGWRARYISSRTGMNSRLDELQAAVLRVKLRYLESENGRRREIAAMYDGMLSGTGVVAPFAAPTARHVYHQYVVRSADRDGLAAACSRAGIRTAVHYPVPIHLQPAYQSRVAHAPSMEVTERLAREVLSLPVSPWLTSEAIDHVGATVVTWARQIAVPR